MDYNYVAFVGTIILQTLIFGLSGYWADRIKNGGEFQPYKLVITLVYATFVAIIVVTSGIVDVTTLSDFMADPTVILTPVWIQYMFVYTGLMYFVNKYIDPIVAKTNLYQSFADYFSTGFTVKPTFPEGKSPYTVTLNMEASPHSGENEVTDYFIDWNDGTQGVNGKFEKGFATPSHTYNFVATAHYTGHTYYPFFMTRNKRGIIKEYNTEKTGRCCAVGVSAQEK